MDEKRLVASVLLALLALALVWALTAGPVGPSVVEAVSTEVTMSEQQK